MTKHIAFFGALFTVVGCGGTTDTGNGPFDGGASNGGSTNGTAGKATSGSSSGGVSNGGVSSGGVSSGGTAHGGVSNGGVSSGGVSSGGTAHGGVSNGGVSNGGVGSGGGTSVDPRCPATTPSGTCSDEGLKCEYNPNNDCLCANSTSVVTFCQQVDPTCTGPTPTPPPAEGSGGFSAKIAAPAHLRCSCVGKSWMCAVGI